MNPASEPRRSGGVPRRWSATWALALLLPFLLSVAVPMTPAAATPSTWEQLGGDIASLVERDESGKAVAIDADGSRVAVGAPEHDGGRGTVRIYDWDGSSWTQVGNNIDGEAAGDQSGTAVSLSSDGSRVAIGAVYNDGNGANSGHVRVYDWNGSSWIQVGSDIDGEAGGDEMGWAVSLSANGSRVAIGAAFNDGNGANSGHVRVYDWDADSSSWIQVGDDIDGEAAADRSGHRAAVSISGDGARVAIGASHNKPDDTNESGHVRVYHWDEVDGDDDGIDEWSQLGPDIDGEATDDLSGRSVSLDQDGSRVAIGAVYNDGNGANSGHVRIYDWDADSSSWIQSGADIDGEAAGDEMGFAVSLSADGSRLAAGAALNDGNGSNSGHVRIYDWNGSAWIQSGTNIDGDAADDVLGRAVSLSADGSRVLVGAPGNDGSAMDAGHVRVYEVLTSSPSACSPSTTSYTSDSTDYTVVTFNEVGTCNWTVPAGVTSVDVLAVGGGGGGGAWVGGGGGGGGVTFSANVPVTPSGSIPVIVGAGGFGASKAFDSLTLGVNGASSSFGSASPVTALGGGVGASWDIQKAGGSGVASGGGGSQNSSTYAGGTGDTSSGGSAATDGQPHAAGGGGGAGGNGENGTGDDSSGTGGAGGPGGISDITGTSVHYGGGGGGGVHGTWSEAPLLLDGSVPISAGDGGVGGGGAGGGPDTDAGVDGEDGTDGLGGGGGGGATHWSVDSAGGDGGSGVVIVRYTLAVDTCTPATTSHTSGSTIYTVLAFKDTGTCSWAIPSGVSKFDWLVVGGGGGGGSYHGAGGGAGGMRSSEGLNVPLDTSFTIQVGAGGDGAPIPGDTSARGSSGGASRITGSSSGVLASVLGGGGGGTGANLGTDGNDGGNGGSGGGSQAALHYGGTAGLGTSGEGNSGGGGSGGGVRAVYVGGGGGGSGAAASGAGEDGNGVTAGSGGDGGTVSWISASVATALSIGEVVGSDVYFAGGGAGAVDEAVSYTLGTGGLGGGGDGRSYADGAGEDGAASTGGGGAGSSLSDDDETRVGGTGGSGVVVLRYGQPAPVTLTYDARGGSGGPGDTTGAPDSTVSVSSTVPTRSGYTFAGWNTQADGSGTAYAAGDTYTLPSSGTVTLHAQWQVVETVTAPPSPADELTDPSESSTPPAPTSSESTPARPSPLVPEAPEPQVPAEGIANQAPPEPSELAVERLVASVDPAPGETVTVTADGFEPDEPVGVHLVTEEEVRAVASTVAAADGAVRAEFVIPSGTCGDLVLVVWAPGSGVGFRQDLNVTGCGLDEGPDVVQVEIASDGAVADGGQGGRLAWWVFALGSVVAVTVIASARRAVDSRRRSGIADTA